MFDIKKNLLTLTITLSLTGGSGETSRTTSGNDRGRHGGRTDDRARGDRGRTSGRGGGRRWRGWGIERGNIYEYAYLPFQKVANWYINHPLFPPLLWKPPSKWSHFRNIEMYYETHRSGCLKSQIIPYTRSFVPLLEACNKNQSIWTFYSKIWNTTIFKEVVFGLSIKKCVAVI